MLDLFKQKERSRRVGLDRGSVGSERGRYFFFLKCYFCLCKLILVAYFTPRCSHQFRSDDYGDCSSVVEPRIVIPVVAGSIPVSHPIF